jgi:hypothetical protein
MKLRGTRCVKPGESCAFRPLLTHTYTHIHTHTHTNTHKHTPTPTPTRSQHESENRTNLRGWRGLKRGTGGLVFCLWCNKVARCRRPHGLVEGKALCKTRASDPVHNHHLRVRYRVTGRRANLSVSNRLVCPLVQFVCRHFGTRGHEKHTTPKTGAALVD